MNRKQRHHWVPRFYLKYFATPETRETAEPQVWILSKDDGDPIPVNTNKVANQRYLYSPRTRPLDSSSAIEDDLADYESVISRISRRFVRIAASWDGLKRTASAGKNG